MTNLTPEQKRKIAKLGEDFRRKMDNLSKCPKCGKPQTAMSMKAGNSPWQQITSTPCKCATP